MLPDRRYLLTFVRARKERNIMSFQGFYADDFDVFAVEGLDARMDALKTNIWPKFEELGQALAPALSAYTGEEMYVHIARHARRKVNPPEDTWVAFADNKRGYKKWPHFQIGLWKSHLFIWFAVIDEAENKEKIAKTFAKHQQQIQSDIPDDYVWSKDHMAPDAISQKEVDLSHMIDRLKNIKKAEILCGRNIKRDNPILKDEEKLLNEIEKTFQTVLPLYQWAKEA